MTLKRTLEPEVMDSDSEALDYDDMDHTAVNVRFVEDLQAFGPPTGNVLDLGCGTAQLPVLLCESNEQVRIMAVDLSRSMLDAAVYNVEAAGLIDRIQLALVDAKETELEDDLFDAVISNSIIHHIPDPRVVLAEAVRITRPGGLLFFRDLMRPDGESDVDRLVSQYAGEEKEHAQQMFRDSLHAALRLDEIQALVSELGFEAVTVEATSDRHWTWAATKPNP